MLARLSLQQAESKLPQRRHHELPLPKPRMWQRQRARAPAMRAVRDEIEIDGARRVAHAATAAEARFDHEQFIEQRLWCEIRGSGNDGVEEARRSRRRVDRLSLDE